MTGNKGENISRVKEKWKTKERIARSQVVTADEGKKFSSGAIENERKRRKKKIIIIKFAYRELRCF